jgi:hypothetical protein
LDKNGISIEFSFNEILCSYIIIVYPSKTESGIISYLYDVAKPSKSIFFFSLQKIKNVARSESTPQKMLLLYLASIEICLKQQKIKQGFIAPESLLD